MAQDNLGLGEFPAPAVIIAIQPAVAGNQAVKADPRAVADIAGGNDIGRTHRAGKAVGIAVIAPPCPLGSGDRPGAVFFGGFFDFSGNGVQRFIPADPLPFAFALFPGPLIGIDNAVGIIDMLDAGKTLGAHRAAGGGIRITFDMGNYAVGHFDQNTAAAVTAFAGGFNDFLFSHYKLRFMLPSLYPHNNPSDSN